MLACVRIVQRVEVEARASFVQASCTLVDNVGGGERELLVGQETLDIRLTAQVYRQQIDVLRVFQIGRHFC